MNKQNLFEGLAEVIAKQVDGNALPLLKPIDVAQDQLAVIGSAAAKADADARLVLEELMDARVRMDCDAVYQQNEWLKHDLDSERKRTLVYKEKYEASEERIVELEEKIVELEEENERQKEEIRSKNEEICKLKAILDYLKENPQQLTIVLSQYNNQTDKRSQVTVQEMVVKDNSVGVQTNEAREEKNGEKDEVGICGYIECDKVKHDTTYGLGMEPEDDEKRIECYNRALLNAFKKGGSRLKFLQTGEQLGYLDFEGDGIAEIYNYLVDLIGCQPYTYSAFYKACTKLGWRPRVKVKPSSSKCSKEVPR